MTTWIMEVERIAAEMSGGGNLRIEMWRLEDGCIGKDKKKTNNILTRGDS